MPFLSFGYGSLFAQHDSIIEVELLFIILYKRCSTVAGQNVLGGGQLGRAKSRGAPGGKTPENFEIFIPKIAVNASNFKN